MSLGRTQRWAVALLAVCCPLLAGGCASTRFEQSGTVPPAAALCAPAGEAGATLVLWRPQWRAEQKDVADREATAERGIKRYFADSSCFAPATIVRLPRRLPLDERHQEAALREARRIAQTSGLAPQRVIVITVRELGPVLRFFTLPALLEGGTEVALDIRLLHGSGSETRGDFHAQWQHGGPWVIKGVATLEQDMVSALTMALSPAARSGAAGTPSR